jgi:hypothetical protein
LGRGEVQLAPIARSYEGSREKGVQGAQARRTGRSRWISRTRRLKPLLFFGEANTKLHSEYTITVANRIEVDQYESEHRYRAAQETMHRAYNTRANAVHDIIHPMVMSTRQVRLSSVQSVSDWQHTLGPATLGHEISGSCRCHELGCLPRAIICRPAVRISYLVLVTLIQDISIDTTWILP